MSLEISKRQVADVVVLELMGRFTLGEASSQFRETIRELVEQGQKKVVADLAGVSYLDSSGIGELVAAYTRLRSEGGDLKLLHLNRRIQDLLQITKLYTVFEVYTDEVQAIQSFQGRTG